MAALVPAIHVLLVARMSEDKRCEAGSDFSGFRCAHAGYVSKTWMPGTRPGMTSELDPPGDSGHIPAGRPGNGRQGEVHFSNSDHGDYRVHRERRCHLDQYRIPF